MRDVGEESIPIYIPRFFIRPLTGKLDQANRGLMNITMKQNAREPRVLQESFSTQDLNLATSLVAVGAKLLAIDRTDPNRCGFVFENSSDLHRVVECYWARQLSIEPQTLLTSLKSIKARLFGEKV